MSEGIIFIGIIINLAILTYCLKRKGELGVGKLFVASSLLILWLIADFIILKSDNVKVIIEIASIKYCITLAFIPFIAIFFIEYTTKIKISRKTLLILCSVPFISFIIILIPHLNKDTVEHSNVIFSSKVVNLYHYSFWFYVEIFYSYLITIFCMMKFYKAYRRPVYKSQVKIMMYIIASVSMLIFNMMIVASMIVLSIDVTPTMLSAMLVPIFYFLDFFKFDQSLKNYK